MIAIEIPKEQLRDFCRKWKITELCLFGSVTREDFRSDSDIDVLATFSSDAQWSGFDHVHMEDELANIMGREVDLVSRQAVEENPNRFVRREILSNLVQLEVA